MSNGTANIIAAARTDETVLAICQKVSLYHGLGAPTEELILELDRRFLSFRDGCRSYSTGAAIRAACAAAMEAYEAGR